MAIHLLLFSVLAIFGAGDVGTTAFPLLKVPVGPRACAMGATYTGLADDVNCLFWNPAGLGRLSSIQMSLSHQEWFAGTRDENFGVSLPLGPGCLGLGAVFSSTEGIEIWDPENNRGEEVSVQGGYAALGYGIKITRRIHCGLAFKALYDQLIENTGIGACADIGAICQPTRALRIGLSAKNLGPGMRYGSEDYPLPITVRLGLSYIHSRFRVLFDANAPIDNIPDFHLGGEYLLNRFVTLRTGLRLGPQDWHSLGLPSMLTAGCGIHYDRFTLDYALLPYGPLGLTHRLALHMDFRASLFGRVRMQVLELKTNDPLEAKLTFAGTHQGMSYTDDNGTFILEGVEPGWLRVTAEADGYNPTNDSLLVEARITHNLKFIMRKAGFGSFWGAVYDAATRRTLAAQVEYDGPTQGTLETDATEGSFILRKLPSGNYDVTITPLDSSFQEQTTAIIIEPEKLTSQTFMLEYAFRRAITDSLPSDSSATEVIPDNSETEAAPAESPSGDELPSESEPPSKKEIEEQD